MVAIAPPTPPRHAFAALYEHQRAAVRAIIAAGRLDDPDAAEGQVWLKAWADFPAKLKRSPHRTHNWRAWLCTIATRIVIDSKRHRAVEHRHHGHRAMAVDPDHRAPPRPRDVDTVPDDSTWGAPEPAADRLNQRTTLHAAIATLNPQHQWIAWAWAAGLPNRAIAKHTGLKPASVKSAKNLITMRLRRAFRLAGYHITPR